MIKFKIMPSGEPEKPVEDWGDGTPLPKITPPNWSHLPKPPGPCSETPCDFSVYEDSGKTGEVINED